MKENLNLTMNIVLSKYEKTIKEMGLEERVRKHSPDSIWPDMVLERTRQWAPPHNRRQNKICNLCRGYDVCGGNNIYRTFYCGALLCNADVQSDWESGTGADILVYYNAAGHGGDTGRVRRMGRSTAISGGGL